MFGSKGRFSFAGIIPLIAQFFAHKDSHATECLDKSSSHIGPVYALGSHYGSSSMNFHEIIRARRKIHRAKMYKRYNICRLRGQRVKSY
jgi:hypothetical protein